LTLISLKAKLRGMNLKAYLENHGGGRRLALSVGVSSVIISQWKTGVRQVPADRCIDIERATSGAVRCEDLRPDVDWAYLRATDCPAIPASEKKAA
jgi:DNA-binding transcriptional regulator YdaS (Cro superfamily)